MSDVSYQQQDVRDFQNPPQLSPCFQIQLKVRQSETRKQRMFQGHMISTTVEST